MDTHQGLDMKKRPGQANGQCGAGEVRGGGLRRRQTRPLGGGAGRGEGALGRLAHQWPQRAPRAVAWPGEKKGAAGWEGGGRGARLAPRSTPPRHTHTLTDPKMKNY
uniref:Uncharacterized protein n=1 Tax=Mus musculus TaxID=10090 RepID=Q3ULS9_MOUSE|nr:unnamed protein product [Mus musculus]